MVDDGWEVRLVAGAESDERWTGTSTGVLDVLVAGVRGERGSLRVVALVADVRLPEAGRDAGRVEVEHREGHAIAVFRLYAKGRFRRGMDYGDITTMAG